MKQVWKYQLPTRVGVPTQVQIPGGAKFLKANADPHGDFINLWFLLRPTNGLESRTFYVYNTGDTIADGTFLRYLDTVFLLSNVYVLHIFEAED